MPFYWELTRILSFNSNMNLELYVTWLVHTHTHHHHHLDGSFANNSKWENGRCRYLFYALCLCHFVRTTLMRIKIQSHSTLIYTHAHTYSGTGSDTGTHFGNSAISAAAWHNRQIYSFVCQNDKICGSIRISKSVSFSFRPSWILIVPLCASQFYNRHVDYMAKTRKANHRQENETKRDAMTKKLNKERFRTIFGFMFAHVSRSTFYIWFVALSKTNSVCILQSTQCTQAFKTSAHQLVTRSKLMRFDW